MPQSQTGPGRGKIVCLQLRDYETALRACQIEIPAYFWYNGVVGAVLLPEIVGLKGDMKRPTVYVWGDGRFCFGRECFHVIR